jgi:hypothetical protein
MGVAVLRNGPLYRPGGEEYAYHNAEEYGFPDAPAFVQEYRQRLAHGDTVVSSPPYDMPIEYEMRRQGVPYRPSPSGGHLIVTVPGRAPEMSPASLEVIRKVTSYRYADVYLATRQGPSN